MTRAQRKLKNRLDKEYTIKRVERFAARYPRKEASKNDGESITVERMSDEDIPYKYAARCRVAPNKRGVKVVRG